MWPTPQDYNEAIQNPELCFRDYHLAQSLPELTALGLPRPISGSFASVYQVRSYSGQWAVRCFLRDVPDQSERYSRIEASLKRHRFHFAVPFEFLSEGIKIGNRWYPILKMEWVSGMPLIDWLKTNAADPAAVKAIAQQFNNVCSVLRDAGIAHGDFQHGNILVTGKQLKVVDYDGMFVPELDGFQSRELGHRHYQHPRRDTTHFGPYLDNFSSWSIHTSLLCLSEDSSLWQELDAGDECLLFRQEDYEAPENSVAFRHLEHHQCAVVRDAARALRMLLAMPVESVPPLGGDVSSISALSNLEPLDAVPPGLPVYMASATPPNTDAPSNLRSRHKKILFAEAGERPRLVLDEDESDSEVGSPQAPSVVRNSRKQSRNRQKLGSPLLAQSTPPHKHFGIIPTGYGWPVFFASIPLILLSIAGILGALTIREGFNKGYLVEKVTPVSEQTQTTPESQSDMSFWYKRGLQYFDSKQYTPALQSFNIALNKASLAERAEVQFRIGLCYEAMSEYTRAFAYFDQAQINLARYSDTVIPEISLHEARLHYVVKQFFTSAKEYIQYLSECQRLGVRPASDGLQGLRESSLAMLELGGLQHAVESYQVYRQFSNDTEFPDFSTIARKCEQAGKFDYAQKIWSYLLARQDSERVLNDTPEYKSRRITILQAMAKNRQKAGELNDAFRFEEQVKDIIDPNRPAISHLRDKQQLLERRYQDIRKQQGI